MLSKDDSGRRGVLPELGGKFRAFCFLDEADWVSV